MNEKIIYMMFILTCLSIILVSSALTLGEMYKFKAEYKLYSCPMPDDTSIKLISNEEWLKGKQTIHPYFK